MPGLPEIPDNDLIREAGPNRAIVEMMRRLKDSNLEQQQATNRLTWWLIVLTVAILVLTVVTAAPVIIRFFS